MILYCSAGNNDVAWDGKIAKTNIVPECCIRSLMLECECIKHAHCLGLHHSQHTRGIPLYFHQITINSITHYKDTIKFIIICLAGQIMTQNLLWFAIRNNIQVVCPFLGMINEKYEIVIVSQCRGGLANQWTKLLTTRNDWLSRTSYSLLFGH